MYNMENNITQSLFGDLNIRIYKLNSDMRNIIIRILEENDFNIKSKNYDEITDDDISTTVYDDDGYPHIFYIKGLTYINNIISMVGSMMDNMNSDYTSWDAATTENYYRCLQFLKGEGK